MIVAGRDDRPAFRRAVEQFRSVQGGEDFLDAAGTISFLALDGGEIAGWCWGQHMIRPDETSMLYLHEIEVAARHRRRGIGRSLVEAFMREGAARGATKMFLSTGAANAAARALYESMGGDLAEQGPTVNYWFALARP